MDDVTLMPTRHKLHVDDFYRIAEAGSFQPHDRVELIDGKIIDMMPIGQGHYSMVGSLTRALVLACGDRGFVLVQCPLRLDPHNEPQPDASVLRPRADRYATGPRPGPADTLLIVEVADSSLHYDKTVKLPLYARAGIPEYWIVDLKNRVLDAYRHPEAGAYAQHTPHGPGERLPLAADPAITVTLDIVFG